MAQLEAVICGLVGTLLDTTLLNQRSFIYALKQFGFPKPTEEATATIMGLPLNECFTILAPQSKHSEEMSVAFRKYQRMHIDFATLYSHTKRVLQWMKDDHMPVAIISHRSWIPTHKLLESTGILGMYSAVITIENSQGRRPPDATPVIMALDSISAHKSKAVMFGGMGADIWAGRNAGCHRTIATTQGSDGEFVRRARPSYVIDDNKNLIQTLGIIRRSLR